VSKADESKMQRSSTHLNPALSSRCIATEKPKYESLAPLFTTAAFGSTLKACEKSVINTKNDTISLESRRDSIAIGRESRRCTARYDDKYDSVDTDLLYMNSY
jgi:hypothetical protein